MTSIRFRLFFIFSLFAGVTLALAYASYGSFKTYRDLRRQMEYSYAIKDEIQDVANLQNLTPERRQHLLQLKLRVRPDRRAEELDQLIQTSGDAHLRFLKERQRVMLKNESEFERYAREQLEYLENRLLYYGGLALFVIALGFVFLQIFVHQSVIRPLQDLGRKMVDFLNDRYTYQFNVPAPDEIGNMQSTFNLLAQRVISNMEQLKTLDQAKSEFLSIASHELRTPLTSIKGSLSLMRSGIVGKMNEMADNLLTIAENETDRLIRLINDILDLAKIEARKLPLHQDWNPWNKLVKTSLESLQGLAHQAKVELVSEAMPPLEAYMDEDRIQQVLTNLLSNAIKFSPQNSMVVVRAEITDKHQLLVEVCDQGRGIAPEDQEAIFQKFRQATNSRNPLVKGTGLGLAIARALVEQHGGEIGVRSVPGEGSTFYFTLPEWRYASGQEMAAAA